MKRKIAFLLMLALMLAPIYTSQQQGGLLYGFVGKAVGSANAEVLTKKDVLETIISQINESRFTWFDSILANNIGPRPYYSTSNVQAAEFIADELNSTRSIFVTYQWFTYASEEIANVIGTLPSADPSNHSKIVVGAHFDTVSNSSGADDNSSGTALLLEVARVLSQFRFGCTIEFVAFNAEEEGLVGSNHYAQQALQSGEDILLAINIDMCIWDNPCAPPNEKLWIVYNGTVPYEDSERFADLTLETSYTYVTAPIQKISSTNDTYVSVENWRRSDHASFWDARFSALWIFEFNGFQNPYIHSPADSMDVESYNFTLGTQAARVVAATVAKLATPLIAASGSSDSWVWVRDTITGAWGEAVVGTGDAIYIGRKSSFYRYRPADNGWTVLAPPPNPDAGDAFKTGTALAWDFDNYIYALYGAATADSRRWFYCYSISGNSWQALADTPYDQGEGDAITWVSLDNRIYATIGGEQRATYFLSYDPSTNSWSDAPADPPAGMGDGASVVWTGDNFLYALRGEFYEESPLCDFWRYSLADDLWTAMADIPADAHDGGVSGVGDGGSLLYVGLWLSNQTGHIYALSGNQAYPESPAPIPDNQFYRYAISTDNWECLADLPFGVGYYVGCRLGYADGHIYAWQGAPSTWTGGGDDLARYEFPIDSTPPIIGIPSRTPSGDVQPEQTVEVSVNVTDAESGVKNVTLFYTINNETSWENRSMNYNVSTNLYETIILGQLAGTWVKFKIVAYDYAGNNATKEGTKPYCTYQVIPEFPSNIIFPLFMVLTMLIIICVKRRVPCKPTKG